MTVATSPCHLCTPDGISFRGEFNWGNVCCRARFIVGLPGIDWRRFWMDRWKARESAEFYDDIARAVKVAWERKTSVVITSPEEVAHG